jgi:hypothetical protein
MTNDDLRMDAAMTGMNLQAWGKMAARCMLPGIRWFRLRKSTI